MSYGEALKKTALFIPVSLFDRGLWRAIGEHAGELLVALVALVGRLGAIAFYPVAVPILAALVVAAERANRRERDRVSRELAAEWGEPIELHAHTHHEPGELRTIAP
jgi:hypothetical protein